MIVIDFLHRNEGQLFGIMGGIIVAIIASFMTYWLSQIQILQNDKKAYKSLIYTLLVEVTWHKNHLKLLKGTLGDIRIASELEHTFVLKEPPMQFSLSIIEASLPKIVNYRIYNSRLVTLLTSYLNQIRDINHYLDFKNAGILLNYIKDIKDIDCKITSYFYVLNTEYLDKAMINIEDIRNLISKELKGFIKEKK